MEKLKISKRLQQVAQLVGKGNSVADIGTDHGYLPIYLVQNGISTKVIAMDVRKGPLSKAEDNICQYGVSEQIQLRLSDGLEKLTFGETDTVTICGMGGRLMKEILAKGMERLKDGTQLILSPQSEFSEFRIYLKNNHIHILDEMMLKEENQYYVIMNCRYDALQQMADDRFGKHLLDKKDAVLYEYLEKELQLKENVRQQLDQVEQSPAVMNRLENVKKEEAVIRSAMHRYES